MVLGLRLKPFRIKCLKLIQFPSSAVEIDLGQRNNLGLLNKLPSNPADSENGERLILSAYLEVRGIKILTDVGSNEGRGIPVALQEDSETVELKGSSTTIARFHVDLCTYKNDESEEDKTIPRKPRLERSAVWEIVSTETLLFQTIVEPKI